MAIQWLEGFDHMGTATLLQSKGWTIAIGAGGTQDPTHAGRIDGHAFDLRRTSTDQSAQKSFASALTTVTVGFAFQFQATPSSNMSYMRLRVGTTLTCQLVVTALGKLQILNSSNTQIALGTTTLNAATWYYVEVKLVVNGASGSVEVHLNGATEIASTTGNFGSTGVDNFHLNVNLTSNTFTIDDIYIVDTTGSANTSFLGDTHVYTLFPTADGNYSQWTPDSGGVHFSRVNEVSGTYPDGDTSYVADGTSGHRDSYVFGDLAPLAGTVYGVQTTIYARKDDAGLRQLVSSVRRSGSDYDSSTTQTLSTSYAFYTDMREVDPSTSAAWTISGVNAAEGGVKVV